MSETTPDQCVVEEVISVLRGKPCWHTSCGGCTIPTFSLSLGDKVLRTIPLPNPTQSDEFRTFTSEVSLYVWSTWRLDDKKGPITSSDDTETHIVQSLELLVGQRTVAARVELPGWDLHLEFSSGHLLHVFCDHMPGEPSWDGNWSRVLHDHAIEIGVGSECTIESRPPE